LLFLELAAAVAVAKLEGLELQTAAAEAAVELEVMYLNLPLMCQPLLQ
jgi:hypothetical protein